MALQHFSIKTIIFALNDYYSMKLYTKRRVKKIKEVFEDTEDDNTES